MTLKVVQVNCVIDSEDRDPEALLAAWPTLPAVAAAAARAGAEVTVLQASRSAAEWRRDGVTYRFVPEPRPRRGCGAGICPWRLAAAVRREAADVVHLNGLEFPFHARAVSEVGLPVLVQDHASRPDARFGRLRRWGFSKVAGAAFTSAEQAAPFVRAGQLPPGVRLFDIPESSSHFTPGDREQARRETGLFGDPALLWIGHLDANKDPLTVLGAVAKAIRKLPGLQLWCAFAGTDLLPEVERRLLEAPDLAAHVHLLGRVAHPMIETLCRASDMFVSASRREGSGYALIEALACGTPSVVTDIPSFRALTGDGITGALVPVGDADAFAKAIVALAARPAEALRPVVTAHFARALSFDVVGARLVEAYASLAAERDRR